MAESETKRISKEYFLIPLIIFLYLVLALVKLNGPHMTWVSYEVYFKRFIPWSFLGLLFLFLCLNSLIKKKIRFILLIMGYILVWVVPIIDLVKQHWEDLSTPKFISFIAGVILCFILNVLVIKYSKTRSFEEELRSAEQDKIYDY